jgi:hypothetical protein
MALLPWQRKQQRIYKGIKSTVLSRWKKELNLSVYDLKNYAVVVINQVDRRPPHCPLAQGCQRCRSRFHFARCSHCDVAKIRIAEYLGALGKFRKATISFVRSDIFEYLSICREFLTFHSNLTRIMGILYDELHTFLTIFRQIHLRIQLLSKQKLYRKSRHTFLTIFRQILLRIQLWSKQKLYRKSKHTFFTIFHPILLRIQLLSKQKLYRKSKHTFLTIFPQFFSEYNFCLNKSCIGNQSTHFLPYFANSSQNTTFV